MQEYFQNLYKDPLEAEHSSVKAMISSIDVQIEEVDRALAKLKIDKGHGGVELSMQSLKWSGPAFRRALTGHISRALNGTYPSADAWRNALAHLI